MNFIGRFLWLILTIAAISLAMVFAVSNTQQVTLQFWPFTGQLEIAAWVLVIGAMAAGALFGGGIVLSGSRLSRRAPATGRCSAALAKPRNAPPLPRTLSLIHI